MKRTTSTLCALTAATLTLSACAQDGGGSDGRSGGSAGSEGPIKLMVIESMTGALGIDQTAPKAAEAAAARINAEGGINGRDIEILECDTASDPNKSTECAREAVDEGVAAVVGSFDILGTPALIPILEASGIPYIGATGTSTLDFTSPVAFPVNASTASGGLGIAQLAADTGCEKVGYIGDLTIDEGAGRAPVYENIESTGIDVYTVDLPTGTADVTPAVSQLVAENPDCVVFAQTAQTAVQVFTAVRRAGSDAQFISATGVVIEPLLPALGEAGEGLLATSQNLPVGHPENQQFRDDIAQYAPEITEPSNFTLSAWQAVVAFAQAAEGLDEVTASTVLDSLNSLDNLEVPGLPPVDFTQERDSETYSRLFNANVRYFKVENGQYVPVDDEWHDLSDLIP